MGRLGQGILAAMMIAGGLGPRIYHVLIEPELTEAQMLRMFWWAYAITFTAFLVFVVDWWWRTGSKSPPSC